MERLTKRTETGVAYLVEPLMLNSDAETRGRVHRLVDRLADFEDGSEIENFYKAKFIEAQKEIKGLNDILDKKDDELKKTKDELTHANNCVEIYINEIKQLNSRINMYRHIIRTVEAVCGTNIVEDHE